MRALVSALALAFAAGLASAQAAHPASKAPDLATSEKAYKSAKAAFAKKPKDAAVKKKYVAATVKFGTATMLADSLPPRQKYSGALRLYREALQYDPKNKEALDNKKMIEDIYKSMGRPIPK